MKVKKILSVVLFLVIITQYCQAQKNGKKDFEGIIHYKNTTFDKTDDLSAPMEDFGTNDILYIKNGYWKLLSDSEMLSYMLWRYNDKKNYYSLYQSSDTLHFNYTYSNPEFLDKYEIVENADTILGYPCNKLSFTNKKGQKLTYYYATELSQDPSYYKDLTNSAKYDILKLTKSIYLRMILETPDIILDTEAVKIKRKKLRKKEFKIPKHRVLLEFDL